MKKLVSLLLCLSLGFFTVARATKPTHTLVAGAKTVHEKATVQRADAENLLNDAGKTLAEENTDDVTSDDGDSLEYPSDEESEEMGDEDTSDDNGGDDGGDNGGGNEGD